MDINRNHTSGCKELKAKPALSSFSEDWRTSQHSTKNREVCQNGYQMDQQGGPILLRSSISI